MRRQWSSGVWRGRVRVRVVSRKEGREDRKQHRPSPCLQCHDKLCQQRLACRLTPFAHPHHSPPPRLNPSFGISMDHTHLRELLQPHGKKILVACIEALLEDVNERCQFTYGPGFLGKLVAQTVGKETAKANAEQHTAQQMRLELDESAFMVAAGMANTRTMLRSFRMREATGRRQAGHGGLLELGDDLLATIADFLKRSVWAGHTWKGHPHAINDCACSPNGLQIVSCSGNEGIQIWNAGNEAGKKSVRTLDVSSDHISSCSFSPSGLFILSATFDSTLKVWNALTGELVHTLDARMGCVDCSCWSLDSKQILSATDNCMVWYVCVSIK